MIIYQIHKIIYINVNIIYNINQFQKIPNHHHF